MRRCSGCRRKNIISCDSEEAHRSILIRYASSGLLVVQWTVPPYEVFGDSHFLPFLPLCRSTFLLSSVYCNVLNIRNALPFSVLVHVLLNFTTYYVKLCFMEVMFSSLYCKFIIA